MMMMMMISTETNGKMTVNYELKRRRCRGLFYGIIQRVRWLD
jgi:hypothetical protein